MQKLRKFFKLEENNTTIKTEVIAGITTFFAMAYIIFVNPQMLSQTDIPAGAVFLATILAAVIGTLVMGLFANVPYAQAAGMGLNAFFVYTVCFGLGFSWQEALGMVFLCGIINIIITVTKVRKMIIKAIPRSLQHAIGAGIGLFIAYIGFKNAGWLNFTADPGTYAVLPSGTVVADSSIVPAITDFASVGSLMALFGIIATIVLLLLKVKGAIIIGIVATTILSILVGHVDIKTANVDFANIGNSFKQLGDTIGVAVYKGIPDMFSEGSKIPMALLAIFAFSLSDTFDTIGTFIGTGRRTGIFSDDDEKALESGTGFKSKMDKALFADAIATSVGALLGTSNTTTYVESAAGIEAGGRTGLTSVVTAICFLLSILIAPFVGLVPGQATAPALIVVGIMMSASFKDIDWTELAEAIPAFITAVLMIITYNISTGIAFGFMFYCLVKLVKGKIKEVHPILYGSAILFVIYYVLMALKGAGIIFA